MISIEFYIIIFILIFMTIQFIIVYILDWYSRYLLVKFIKSYNPLTEEELEEIGQQVVKLCCKSLNDK